MLALKNIAVLKERAVRPHLICHMISSVDGRLASARWTKSPDGTRQDWSSLYSAAHEHLRGDAWIVGRVTMAEMTGAAAHPGDLSQRPERRVHLAKGHRKPYAIALDPSGKLHFGRADIDGDHIIVLLSSEVSDRHLSELASDGLSYIVSTTSEIDLRDMLEDLAREFDIQRLLLEGGGGINGSFFSEGLVDELSLIVAPAVDGRSDSRTIVEAGAAGLAGALQLSFVSCHQLAHGAIHLRYTVTPETQTGATDHFER